MTKVSKDSSFVKPFYDEEHFESMVTKDLRVEHPYLAQAGESHQGLDIDVSMSAHFGWNHVIGLKMNNVTKDLLLIPSTSKEDVILQHNDCRGC